jgi:O-antigen biosynthesis protein
MRICIVSTVFLGTSENGSFAPEAKDLACLLSQKHDVQILTVDMPAEKSELKKIFRNEPDQKRGVTTFGLEYPPYELHTPFLCIARSFLVYFTLKNKSFDLIIFHDLDGLGYYSMLAKNLHLAFGNTQLVLNFFGLSEWCNFQNQIPINRFSTTAQNFIEKKTYEMADHILFPTQIAKTTAQESALVLKNPSNHDTLFFPIGSGKQLKVKAAKVKTTAEICFFGVVETRSGIEIFLNAVSRLANLEDIDNLKVTVVGPPGKVRTLQSKEFLSNWSMRFKIPLKIVDVSENFNAISYLKKNKAIAVLPYIEDLTGYHLISCIKNNVPVICSDIPAFQEIIEFFGAKNFLFFQNRNEAQLSLLLNNVFKNKDYLSKTDLKKPKYSSENFLVLEKAWFKAIKNLSQKKVKKNKNRIEKLSVCIIFFDRPEFLTQCIKSLSPIGKFIDEILVYINSDEQPQSKLTIDRIKKIPKVRCIYGKQNVSPGFAQNILTREAKCESLLFLDDDNILNFRVFERLWKTMDSGWDIVCCTLKKFQSSNLEDSNGSLSPPVLLKKLEKISYAEWLPLGSCIPLSLFHNYIGDNNFLIKRSHLLKIGGVNETMLYNEDAELIIRSIRNKGRYFLSPESFVYYRRHSQNLSSEEKNFVTKDYKSMRPILQTIQSESLLPILLMAKNLAREKKGDFEEYCLSQIELASKFRKFQNLNTIQNVNRLRKIFKNKIKFSRQDKSIVCCFDSHKKSLKFKNLFPEKTMHFIFFSQSELDIVVNDSPYKLKKGYNAVTITFDQRVGISIFSCSKKINFVEVLRTSIENYT